MKNIHILQTGKPSRLHEFGNIWFSHKEPTECFRNYEIYINSDEEIKEGDWFHLDMSNNDRSDEIHQMGDNKWSKTGGINFSQPSAWTICCKKIILTTDPELIKDGVQAIDDEFIEWFVNNPGCEYVEVKVEFIQTPDNLKDGFYYKIIIPQEEEIV
jgi:hypothetical protein